MMNFAGGKRWLCGAAAAAWLCMSAVTVQACTLFGAQGTDYVEGGGTILVKNRDWHPQAQSVRLVTDRGPYRFYGLYGGAAGGKQKLRGGVNEKGLAVVLSAASCVSRELRNSMPRRDTMTPLLANCATVEEALQQTQYFVGAKNLMLADATELAVVEIGEDGKFHVERKKQGTLAHTNHYLQPEFTYLDTRPGESSHHRYARITQLLQTEPHPFTMEDMIRFSQDQTEGPDNSIWRTGGKLKNAQTLATMVFHLRAGQAPDIYIKYRRTAGDKGHEAVEHFTFGQKDTF